MPYIAAGTSIITQINVFTVKPENTTALIDLLIESAKFVQDTPGWISASIHCNAEGTRVVNYAQSQNMEAAQRIIARLRDAGYLDRNKQLAEASPGLYEVVATLEK